MGRRENHDMLKEVTMMKIREALDNQRRKDRIQNQAPHPVSPAASPNPASGPAPTPNAAQNSTPTSPSEPEPKKP